MAVAPLRAPIPRRWLKRRWAWRHLFSSTRQGPLAGGANRGMVADALQADFEAFFGKFEYRIYGYLLRMVGNPDAARDLTQETFLRAWKEFDSIAPHRDNGKWLFRVASNLAINYHRHSKTPVGSTTPLDNFDDYLYKSDPNKHFADRERILEILQKLTAKQRAVLVLHEVDDYTCEEIGQMLHMTGGAVKMMLSRARERFAQIYLDEERSQ